MKRFFLFFCAFLGMICSLQAASDTYWGYHLMLDCKACNIESVTSKENIEAFVKTLVEKIDMKAYGEPTVVHFAEHDPAAAGYSLVQLIETSNITGHFVDCNGDAYIDIFSCKYFDIEIAKRIIHEFFSPKQIKIAYLTRQA